MKKLLFVLLFLVLSIVGVSAEVVLYNDEQEQFTDGQTICANREYYLDTPSAYSEFIILDSDTNVILEVLNSNTDTLAVTFPENAGNITIVQQDYNESGVLDPNSETSISLVVEPCEYSVVKEDYTAKNPYATISYADGIMSVTPPTDMTDYAFSYQFVGGDNAKTNDKLEPFTIELKENTIVQFTETYTNDKGEVKTDYYELEINTATDSYFIRNVNSFEIKTIDAKSLINVRLLALMLIIFIILLVLLIKHKKLKKKIKKKEASRR